MTVSHILSSKGRSVATIDPNRTLAEAARLLSERRIGALVIIDGSQPVAGIISERDIVRALASRGATALEDPISQHMTREVVTCTGRSPIHDIMQLMTDKKFRHLPVVENGALAGIISIGDVVKHRLAEVEAEAQAIKDYIATA